jgi:hypothetical protein
MPNEEMMPVIILLLFFGGWGIALLFFADRMCEWQIRRLQSKGYRLFTRVIGALLIVGSITFAAIDIAAQFKP